MKLWHTDNLSPRDLARLADGSLSGRRRERVEHAVAASAALQADIDAQRRALAAVEHTAGERAPAALRLRVAPPQPRRVPRPVSRRTSGGVLAALALTAGVLVLVVGTGGPGAPTVAQAAQLASARPQTTVPRVGSGSPTIPITAAGIQYPNYEHFGVDYRPTGARYDRLGGRRATTVFYTNGGLQIAYTIVSGPPISSGGHAINWSDGLQVLHVKGLVVVAFLRDGHTCVLTGPQSTLNTMLVLAAYKSSASKRT